MTLLTPVAWVIGFDIGWGATVKPFARCRRAAPKKVDLGARQRALSGLNMEANLVKHLTVILNVALLAAGSAVAAVSPEEAAKLGGDTLTAFGAEKAGNKDGTIPPYTGEAVKAPASWDPKEPGRRPDPFNEKPLFSITAKNADGYAARLSDGTKELFKKYPAYRMDIYATHRSMVFPKYVLDNTIKNATACKGVDDDLGLNGCFGGLPFPIPKTGRQAMWNHLLQYESHWWWIRQRSFLVPPSGRMVLTGDSEGYDESPYYDPKRTAPMTPNEEYFRVRLDSAAPARQAGEKLVVLDALDQAKTGRRVYQYIPGQRRVKLAPNLSYDTPSPYSGGSQTMDDAKIFIGALDRYEFKLVGKQEKYIPYNAFNLTDYKACPEEKIASTPNFPNPDCVRWELHRVWVVQATLKEGYRHIYKTRTFYWDEDGFGAGMADNYDASGKIYRVILGAHYPLWEGGANGAATFAMDLLSGAYSAQASSAVPGSGVAPSAPKGATYFSPESLAGEGIR